MWDTIIVGAGPGGTSAAIWAQRLGLGTLVLEASHRVGGQLNHLHGVVVDYPGLMVDKGLELAPYFARHLEALEVPIRLNCAVTAIDVQRRLLALGPGERLEARAIVLATGATRRRLGVPGEQELWGRGASDSPSRDIGMAKGREVVVVGGGDAALENALLLSDTCARVSIVHRRLEFRGRPEFQEKLCRKSNVRFYLNAVVREIVGQDWVCGVRIEHEGRSEVVPAEAVFIKIGVVPSTALVKEQLGLEPSGYLTVSRCQETTARGVYAVGDVCNPLFSSIATAVGQGMIAAKSIERELRAGRLK